MGVAAAELRSGGWGLEFLEDAGEVHLVPAGDDFAVLDVDEAGAGHGDVAAGGGEAEVLLGGSLLCDIVSTFLLR